MPSRRSNNFRHLSFKSDLMSLEHPLFALRGGDKKIRHYEHRGNFIQIIPGAKGLATIHDKDVLIYCKTKLLADEKMGIPIKKTVRFIANDYFNATNRPNGGESYDRLDECLDRIKGTTIKTNILSDNRKITKWFGLVEEIKRIENLNNNSRMAAIEITLSDWIVKAVINKKLLTIDKEYFLLTKPLKRRLYEIARKHCGHQIYFNISLPVLHKKSGSTGSLTEFQRQIRTIMLKDREFPGYYLTFNIETNIVTIYKKSDKGKSRMLADHLKATSGSFLF